MKRLKQIQEKIIFKAKRLIADYKKMEEWQYGNGDLEDIEI